MLAMRIISGLLAGMLAGIAIVLLNPLPSFARLAPLTGGEVHSFSYQAAHTRGIEPQLREFLGLPGRGSSRRALSDPALRHLRASLIVLPDPAGGEPALGVRISVLARDNAVWRGRLGLNDYWLIGLPGQGALFADGHSNYWHYQRDHSWGTVRGGAAERLAERYPLSAQATAAGSLGLTGGNGIWRGQRGELRETLLPQAEGAPGWVIDLRLPAPVPPVP